MLHLESMLALCPSSPDLAGYSFAFSCLIEHCQGHSRKCVPVCDQHSACWGLSCLWGRHPSYIHHGPFSGFVFPACPHQLSPLCISFPAHSSSAQEDLGAEAQKLPVPVTCMLRWLLMPCLLLWPSPSYVTSPRKEVQAVGPPSGLGPTHIVLSCNISVVGSTSALVLYLVLFPILEGTAAVECWLQAFGSPQLHQDAIF